MARKSVLEQLLEDHQTTYAPPEPDLGNGVVSSDMGAYGVLPRGQRPAVPDITVSGSAAPAPERAPEVPQQAAPAPALPPPVVPEAMGAPRMFRSSAGPDGAYNMGEMAPPGSVATNRMGVPQGQTMVPVYGLSRGQAMAGVPELPPGQMGPARSRINLPPDISGATGSIDNLDRVASESPMVRGLVNSGVLKASQAETDTLRRMGRGTFDAGTANTRGQQNQQQDLEFARGQQAADAQAQRQIAVAQGTPQIVASGAGVGGWDPSTGQPFSEVRAPNVYNGKGATRAEHEKIMDQETGMNAAQLLAAFSKTRPRAVNDPLTKQMLASAIQQAAGDPERIRQAQEMFGKDNPGDPQMMAYYQRRLHYLGIDPLAEAGPPTGAPAAQAPAASAPAAQAAPQPAAAPTQSFRDKYARK